MSRILSMLGILMLTSTMPLSAIAQDVSEQDPCAAYTSERGRLLCEQQLEKRKRMMDAKDGRFTFDKERKQRLEDKESRFRIDRINPDPVKKVPTAEEKAKAAQEELKKLMEEAVIAAEASKEKDQDAGQVEETEANSKKSAPEIPTSAEEPADTVNSEIPDMDKIAEELKKLQ